MTSRIAAVALSLFALSALALTGPPPPPPTCTPPAILVADTKNCRPLTPCPIYKCVVPPQPVVTKETRYPAFKPVTLMYAPPGRQSSVSYGTGSTAGATQTTSFATQTSVSYGGQLTFFAGVSVDQSFTFGTSTSHAERISKAQTVTLGLSNGTGATDVPDHGYDMFWLWVNPRVDLTWSDGVLSVQEWKTSDGGAPRTVPFTVRELQGVDPIPSYKLAMLNGPLSASDVATLLSMDPFVTGEALDAKRFHKVTTQTIWGPDNASDPVPNVSASWNYSTSSDDSFSTSEAERTAIMVKTGFSFLGILGAEARAGVSFGVTFTQGLTESNGDSQTANVMLRSNTPCHAMDVDVLFDKVFGTYAAVPVKEYHCSASQKALARDAEGKPAASQLVTYQRPSGAIVQTYTDAEGQYPIYQ
jgi:hypothetical protein